MPHHPGADLRSFHAVDEAEDAAPLIRALTVGKASPEMSRVGTAMTAALELADARSVLDLGCGPGTDALEMAAHLPPGGRVTGVDVSRVMVEEAVRRARGSGAPVSFVEASAVDIPFADGTFDRCRALSLLQHLTDPMAAVRETARVVRAGGRVAAFEFDLGTGVVDHPDRALTRAVLDYVTDSALHGWLGRQVPRLYRRAGFTEVTVTPRWIPSTHDFFVFTLRRPLAQAVRDGVLTARQVTRWLGGLKALQDEGNFLAGSTGYLVTAVKP